MEKKGDEKLTPWEKCLKKKKEKRKKKNLEKRESKNSDKLLGDAQQDESPQNDDLLQDDDVPSDVDLNDSYFQDAYKESGIETNAGKNRKP